MSGAPVKDGGGNAQPEVRRKSLPPARLQHLLTRIQERSISADKLGLLATWLDQNPVVPAGQWFKRFPGMITCGEGELVKTFLTVAQTPGGRGNVVIGGA